MDTYNRPALLKEAVDALFRQTYDNLEIILVNNGATPETIEYLNEVSLIDKRVKIVHFKENQYSPDDPLKMIDTCLNSALKIATGDYVWYQADDDLIADDYIEKMVALFKENSECITTAGIPVSIDIQGNIIDTGPRTSNYRPRYMPGHMLALDHLREGKMFSAPGSIFTIKRDVLIRAGGFHRAIELSQLYGIVPFGVTGFEETALFYWRRHEGQLNKQLTANGWLGIDEFYSLMRDWRIANRWQVFGTDKAKKVVSILKSRTCKTAAHWFAKNLLSLRPKASLNIVSKMYSRSHFWSEIPGAFSSDLWRRMRQLLQHLRPPIKYLIKSFFKFLPGLSKVSPWFAHLRERVNR
jgi:glycosyltransferase involved in cell wall biosynthesis